MLRIVGYEEKIWNEKHKLLKHFQINAFWVISGDQLHCKQLLHSPKLTSTCIIPKLFFERQWGINNLWTKKINLILFPKLHIVQERSCCSTLVFGFTNHILLEGTLISLKLLCIGLCVFVAIVKNMFFYFYRFTQLQCDGHLAQCLSEMNEDIIWWWQGHFVILF